MATITDLEPTGIITVHDARTAFRATVAEVAARAKAKLPEAVNGRIESAVKLVLSHDVVFHADGTVEVGSASDPMKTYTLAGHACDCQDFAYGKAPGGWCQHRLAAAIAKRVGELLAAPVPVEPDVVPEAFPDNAPEPVGPPVETPPAPASPAVPPGLPEAPASVNVRLTIDGRDCQLTLRDSDEGRLLERLCAVLAQYPAPASPQGQPTQGPGDTPQCPTHGPMKPSRKGQGWYCPHKLDDDTWCKSKGK